MYSQNMVHAWASRFTLFKWTIRFKTIRVGISHQYFFEMVKSVCWRVEKYCYTTLHTDMPQRLNQENSGIFKKLCFMSIIDIVKVNPFAVTKCKGKEGLEEKEKKEMQLNLWYSYFLFWYLMNSIYSTNDS